jgi:serine protease Do
MMNFRNPRRALALGLIATLVLQFSPVRAQEKQPDKQPAQPVAVPNVQLGDLLAPKAFRAAAARVLPTMVTIESFGGVAGASGAKRGQMAGIRMPGEGPTTGVIISSDGYIVTSTFNFLKKPPIITVVLPDGSRKVASLLGSDETRKLCLLKVEGVEGLPVPEFAPRSQVRVGQWAVALGVGFGDDEPAFSAGIISAASRIQGRAVQTDANLSPANYGGPLVDLEGRVIGICVPLSPQSREVASGVEWYDSGIGFAVPLDGADQLLTRLKAGETIKPGRLGIQAQPTPDQKPGAIVGQVVPGSPAETAGLKAQDRILSINEEEVLDATHLVVLVNKNVAGDELKLRIRRGEEELDLTATLAVAVNPPPMNPMGAKPMPGDKPEGDKPAEKQPEGEKPAEPAPDQKDAAGEAKE